MNSNYEKLFTVHFKHEYFTNDVLASIAIKPTNETIKLIRDYELVLRNHKGSFSIHYPTVFASETNTRDKILADQLNFNFTLECNDPYLLNYTSNLPNRIENLMFNFQYPNVSKNKLHQKDFVSETDLVDFRSFEIPYFAKPFGHLKIVLDKNMPLENYIKFAAPSLYWRYIIKSPYLLDYSDLAIMNKLKNIIFDGPYPANLPNGEAALTFVSPSTIPQKELSDLNWQLVEQYNEKNSGRVVLPNLPHPNHKMVSFIGDDYKIEGQKRVLDIII